MAKRITNRATINTICFGLLLTFLFLACGTSKTYRLGKGTFTDAELAMIMNEEATLPMRVYKINRPQDSLLLRKKSMKVIIKSEDHEAQEKLNHFTQRLLATVQDSISLGVGIAAPQVGILQNIIWVQRFDKEGMPFEVYINPEITKYSLDKQDCLEGCLSIPDRKDMLSIRSKQIEIVYQSMDSQMHKDTVEGFTAVIFQHEIDHLHGILYTDHLLNDMKSIK